MTTDGKPREGNDYILFYVLGGFVNGSRDDYALTTNERRLEDGHYYLLDGEVDPSHPEGFDSVEEAREAAEAHVLRLKSKRWLIEVRTRDGKTSSHHINGLGREEAVAHAVRSVRSGADLSIIVVGNTVNINELT